MARVCAGCDLELAPNRYQGNPRKWCSGACQAKAYRRNHPDYVARMADRARRLRRANYVPVVHDLTCSVCRSPFEAKRPDARYCSDPCRFRQAYIGRRARRVSAPRERYTVREIGDRDNWTCGICADVVDPALNYPDLSAPSIDHAIPLALGGSDLKINVQIAHLHCNRQKGSRVAA